MHRTRPKNLNLFTIHFPLPAIVSILHRISGAFLFLCIPIVLWLLAYSLTDSGFDVLQQWLGTSYVKLIFWLIFVPFWFHLAAGIRHLLSDIHIGDALKISPRKHSRFYFLLHLWDILKTGKAMSLLTFIVTVILAVLAGVWLW